MCRNRRDRRKSYGQVMFITARVYKGLPFVARHSMERVLEGIIARAQGQYPVKICAYVFMGNHYHMILTGQSCHFSPFLNYIQGEIARSIKKLIPGVYDGGLWDGRYSEQIILTVEDVISKMAYIYLNPVRARLVGKASEYPGLNSYKYLHLGETSLLSKWIPSGKLKALPDYHNRKQDLETAANFLKSAKTTEQLHISPFAWFSSFTETLDPQEVTKRLMAYVRQEEELLTTPVLGAHKLTNQKLRKHFVASHKQPTPYIICHDRELRKHEIISYQDFCQACRQAWQLIKKGVTAIWPKGAYRPSMRWGPMFAS